MGGGPAPDAAGAALLLRRRGRRRRVSAPATPLLWLLVGSFLASSSPSFFPPGALAAPAPPRFDASNVISNTLRCDPKEDDAAGADGRLLLPGAARNKNPNASNWAGANSYFLHALPPKDRDAVLDHLQDAGFKVVRIFIQGHLPNLKNSSSLAVPDVEPEAVGAFSSAQLELVDALMVACLRRGLKLNIALHNRYSLGCWRQDAHAKKYALPTARGLVCRPAQQNDASSWYASREARRDVDRRLAFIASHRNRLLGGRRWADLHEVVFGFDIQNESQAYLPNGIVDAGWVCERARALKPLLDPRILIVTGGGSMLTDSALPAHFECPWIDVVALHSYSPASWGEMLPCVVREALRRGKRVIAQEFGAKAACQGGGGAGGGGGGGGEGGGGGGGRGGGGEKRSFCSKAPGLERQIEAIEAAGVPWMVWQAIRPNSQTEEEVFVEDEAAWKLLKQKARALLAAAPPPSSLGAPAARNLAAGRRGGGAFAWPELEL